MRYVDFRDLIQRELRQNPSGLTWAELKERLSLTYDRPCPTWVARMEQEVGLARMKGSGRAYLWKVGSSEQTNIEWIYEPADLFEATYKQVREDYELALDAGRAVAALCAPLNPVPPDVVDRIKADVEGVLLLRQLQVHRKYSLEGARICQYSEGHKNVSIEIGCGDLAVGKCQADVLVKDAADNVMRDSRAERISEHHSSLAVLAPKVIRSTILRSLLESYSRSISDPNDELVHLYEIRDALCKHFGGEKSTCAALGISASEWSRMGALANAAPVEQGRHRGQHPEGRRAATDSELDDARQLAVRWIMAFADSI